MRKRANSLVTRWCGRSETWTAKRRRDSTDRDQAAPAHGERGSASQRLTQPCPARPPTSALLMRLHTKEKGRDRDRVPPYIMLGGLLVRYPTPTDTEIGLSARANPASIDRPLAITYLRLHAIIQGTISSHLLSIFLRESPITRNILLEYRVSSSPQVNQDAWVYICVYLG